MKYTLTLLTLLISSLCFSQTLVDVNKIYIRKDIQLSDGLTYKWDVVAGNDTARYFVPGNDVYEATVVFKKKGVIDIIDDANAANVYSTPWTKISVANGQAWASVFENQTCSHINTAGATLTYTFTGKRIEVWQEKSNNKGMIAISLGPGATASGAETTVDLYAATAVNNTQMVWTSADLTPGQYTIKIRVTGTKAAASSNTYSVHDYLKVIK